jgi:hypothetical protein
MCDAVGADGSSLQVVAFIGGLDITLGRYDTAHHHLFPVPDGRFDNDFMQVDPPSISISLACLCHFLCQVVIDSRFWHLLPLAWRCDLQFGPYLLFCTLT